MGRDIPGVAYTIAFGGITALLAVAIMSAIVESPAAIQPGDPLYPVQQLLVSSFSTAIVLAVPGSLLVLGYILSQLK
jgi:hypothetical protein